ncbi:unnamed protein product [Microthlaspi erraticum]|uniref:Uncharacterized protein n=1 Tax=Microthlaspi erraticum TaxID=1685480 RepID=A0A6D2LNC5_9BRAS|nr:unnamed protein product [Microthlaspi erraticum]
MNVSFDRIDRLSSDRTNWCVVVKVVKTWAAFEADGLEYFNFLLIDPEISLILKEWKCIRNFTVVVDESERRLTRIRNKIFLIGRTEVTRAVDPRVYQPMDLVTFEDVVHRTTEMGETYPVDFIGRINYVKNLNVLIDNSLRRADGNTSAKIISYIDFRLYDNQDHQIMCRVKGELADIFYDRWLNDGDMDYVCCLYNWRITPQHPRINVESVREISSFEINPPWNLNRDADRFCQETWRIQDEAMSEDDGSSRSDELFQ